MPHDSPRRRLAETRRSLSFLPLAAEGRRPYEDRVGTTYRLLLLLKLTAVLVYAGGLVASLVASAIDEKKRAVHGIALAALLLIWATGYGLATLQGIALTELWIAAALGLSFASQLALVVSVSRGWRPWITALAAGLPLFAVLALMVFKPTWAAFAMQG